MAAKKTPARPTTRRKAAPTRRVRAEPPAAKTGGMTVQEAGRKGGLIGGRKGGETVKAERGIAFYQEIGRKGGQRVRQLIEAGRAAMAPPTRTRKGR
jgi:hypothetical protein